MQTKVKQRKIPGIISVDDHVLEPAGLWEERLPARFRAQGPRVERDGVGLEKIGGITRYVKGGDGPPTSWWLYEDHCWACPMPNASAGIPREDHHAGPISYEEMRASCYEVAPRLEDMSLHGVERALCFPSFSGFCGQTFVGRKDPELAALCVEAFNDWMLESWCGSSGGRLIPLCLAPLWDPERAAREVRRNAARGCRAVAFSELPSELGLPSIHDAARRWDPFFSACNETGTTLCMHIGGGARWRTSSEDAPAAVVATLTFSTSVIALTDWLFSGLLERFPNLKLSFAEGQIGWMPFVIERADAVWERSRGWSDLGNSLPHPPSHYVPGRIYGCFFDDPHGLASRHAIGIDQITFETDFPHQDSHWPDTLQLVEGFADALSDEELHKILRGNAMRMLELEELPAPVEATGRRG